MYKRAYSFLLILVILLGIGIGPVNAQGGAKTPITLDNAYRLQQQAILGHGAASCLSWSPDGSHLAVGSTAGIWLYNPDDLTSLPRLLETSEQGLTDLVYSPNGTYLAGVFTVPNVVVVWDAVTGAKLQVLDEVRTPDRNGLAFSSDSTLLAVANWSEVKFWDLAAKTWMSGFSAEAAGNIGSVAFNPASGEIAGSAGGQVIILNPETRAVRSLPDVGGSAIMFSPDGMTLVAGGEDGFLRLVDAQTGNTRFSLKGHIGDINQMAFSPDGTTLLSASDDGSLRLWNFATGELLRTLDDQWGAILAAAFSPDGTRVASVATGMVRLWNPSTGEIVHTFEGYTAEQMAAVVFSPDGNLIAGGNEDGTITLWNTQTGAIERSLIGHLNWVFSLAFSPDGTVLASGSADHTIRLWNVASGETRRVLLNDAPAGFYSLAFDPTGSILAAASSDGEMLLWDAATDDLRRVLNGHADSTSGVIFSSDGSRLASCSIDGTVQIWDMASYTSLATLIGHTDAVVDVTFNPAGDTLASASIDGTVRLWSIPAGTPLNALGARDIPWQAVTYNADGSVLASVGRNGVLRLWKPDTGVILADLAIPVENIVDIVLNPAGDTLATADTSGVVRLWRIRPNQEVLTIGGPATIQVTGDETLNFRDVPGVGGTVLGVLSNETPVTVLEGPQSVDDYTWWRVETPTGAQGWVVESADGVQTLVP
jgi:WD40 repeat protein